MSNNSGIYKLTNRLTKDCYIGSTYNFSKRKTSHFNLLAMNKHANRHLQNVYNKYGSEIFIFEIIARCPVEYLLKLEQWFIDNIKPKYNICKIAGNLTGTTVSEETREKIRKKMKVRTFSEEHRKKLKKAIEGKTGKLHPAYGKKRTKEYIENHKKKLYKKVIKLSLDNEEIKVYESVLEAAKENNAPNSSLAQACRRNPGVYKNFKWKYE